MIDKAHCEKLWQMIKPIKVGMLVTEDEGHMCARPMHLVQDEFDGAIWFYTNDKSSKVAEMKADAQIGLAFADHGSETYVALNGTGSLSKDKAKIAQYWNPFIAAYFPKGQDDPDLTMLRIDVQQAEYWDSTSSRMVQLFEFLKANITKVPPSLGEHEKIG